METTTTDWEQSAELGELFKALAAAQGEMENASKSKDNPFFKSKYADLAAIKEVTQPALTKHGLAVTSQNFTRGSEAGVRTILGHCSGQWMACVCTTVPKDRGPQAMGSCWSYLRRYSKSALLDIATEDDDAETAEGRDRDKKPPGATWGKERSTPKASAPARGASADNGASKSTATTTSRATSAPLQSVGATTGETGEVLDPGQLQDLTEAFDTKWGRGARTAAPSWLKAQYGTDDVASLTKIQAAEALQKLLAS